MFRTITGTAALSAAAVTLGLAGPASAASIGVKDPQDTFHGSDLRAVQLINNDRNVVVVTSHTNLRRDPRTGSGGAVYLDTDPGDKGPDFVFVGGFFEGTDYQLVRTEGFGVKRWGAPVHGSYEMTVDYARERVRMRMSRAALGEPRGGAHRRPGRGHPHRRHQHRSGGLARRAAQLHPVGGTGLSGPSSTRWGVERSGTAQWAMPTSSRARSRRSRSGPPLVTTPSTVHRTIVGAQCLAKVRALIRPRTPSRSTQATAPGIRSRARRASSRVATSSVPASAQSWSAWSRPPASTRCVGSGRSTIASRRRPRRL